MKITSTIILVLCQRDDFRYLEKENLFVKFRSSQICPPCTQKTRECLNALTRYCENVKQQTH